MGSLNINNPKGGRNKNHYQNSDLMRGSSQRDLQILHQNIRGLKGKTEEIMNNIVTNPPHVLCFTEHHSESHQLDCVPLPSYRLIANFCRTTHRYGGVCVYVHESLQASSLEILKYCTEKDLEVCSVRLYLPTGTIGIVTLYRSPSGNFNYFIKELEILLIFYQVI